jgi:phosphate-selective porin OprO/OprP
MGALEFAGRYDLAENSNQNLAADPCRTGTYLTEAMIGHADLGTSTQEDNLSVLSVCTQISF